MNERLERWMDEVLDGTASREDAERLEQALARDPEARARFEELRAMFNALVAVPAESAPEGLRASVMADVTRTTRERRAAAPLRPSGRPAFVRVALAFACGVAVTALAGTLMIGGGIRQDGLSFQGTMLHLRPATPLALGAPEANLVARLTQDGDAVRADVDVRGAASAIALRSDSGVLHPTTVRWSGGSAGTFATDAAGVTLHPQGATQYQVWFHVQGNAPAALEVRMTTASTSRAGTLTAGDGSGNTQQR